MMKTRDTYETLAREAAVFHRSLFRSEVPKGIREKYIDAHRFVLVEADQGPEDKLGRLIRLAIHRRLDPEALEIALRKKLGTANLLTQKINILLYLVEEDSRYYGCFYNEKQAARLKAYLSLGFHTVRSAWKSIKGRYLLWRYSNCMM